MYTCIFAASSSPTISLAANLVAALAAVLALITVLVLGLKKRPARPARHNPALGAKSTVVSQIACQANIEVTRAGQGDVKAVLTDDDATTGGARKRLRDLGVQPGLLPVGANNAITDVPGVKVGHTTIVSGVGALVPGHGPVRTGVTVILPHSGDLWNERVSAGAFALNGNGCVTGLDWVRESGFLEGPMALTNTHSVGDVYKGVLSWMIKRYPQIGTTDTTALPVVGECDDSPLNDIQGFHVKEEHVFAALDSAQAGIVAEGAVGAGTGMTCYGFKGGIGTASRVAQVQDTAYTVGVLVNANHGRREQLIMAGVPVGQIFADEARATLYREGSIVIVVATDAPLSSRQLNRVAKRAAMGLARTGACANNSSGDFILAFSTTRKIVRVSPSSTLLLPELVDDLIDPVFQAAVEATEEAILNALCMAKTTVGCNGNISPELPLGRVLEILAKHGRITSAGVKGSGKPEQARKRITRVVEQEIPPGAIKVDLPNVFQPDDYSCGAAGFMAIAAGYGVGPDEIEEIKKALGTNPEYGTYYADIVDYALKLGLDACARNQMSKEELKQLLTARVPVMLSIQAYADDEQDYEDPENNENGHYVDAIGFDDDDNFYFMDPSLTGRVGYLPWNELDKRWHENEGSVKPELSHHLGLVIRGKQQTLVYTTRARKIT